jgi:hypothetical protein
VLRDCDAAASASTIIEHIAIVHFHGKMEQRDPARRPGHGILRNLDDHTKAVAFPTTFFVLASERFAVLV